MVETLEEPRKSRFTRRLGVLGATNIGLGAMLGGGIYVISGTAAGIIGPALVYAYLATGLMTIFTALNCSELACSIPKQGGGYTFAQNTWGGFPGFLTGWFMLIGNVVACGLYALAVAHTIAVFIPGLDPTTDLFLIGLIAIVFIVITWATNLISIKGVSGVLGILNIGQAIVLFVFVFVGMFFIQPTNLSPLFITEEGVPVFGAFMSTIAFIYISFVGFELITTASEEIKEPAKTIPRAIMLTVIIATAVYMAAALVIVGIMPSGPGSAISGSATPISDTFGAMIGNLGFCFALAGMAASNYAALNATFMAAARVTYSLGRDRYFPSFLDRVHPRLKTPVPALIVTLIAVSVFASTGNVVLVASLAGFAYLIGLSIVNSSVIKLRRSGLSVPGTFKTKLYPVVPILGTVFCLMLVPSIRYDTLTLGLFLSLMGFMIYLGYGRNRNNKHRDGG